MRYSRLVVAGIGLLILVGGAPVARSGTTGNGSGTAQPNSAMPAPAPVNNYDHDLYNAKFCKAHPQIMNTSPVCIDVKARHLEMFSAAPKSSTPG